jgi:hypothetical protein
MTVENGDTADKQLGDLLAMEGLPQNREEALDHLRTVAEGSKAKLTHCPECGVDLTTVDAAKHSVQHWPSDLAASQLSPEAQLREAALYRTAGAKPPARRP